ncbi:GlxA family transcriptional regulator [Pedobacter metabolipauper]|uniref:GlxA family transcriptional regulator n=1 Tax=Pedobacter metabolipauper TaxID=425513 RepID=UPI001FB5F532|nr:helix-turn-helix domain-containing protein [Pedobacter metabolipauper]
MAAILDVFDTVNSYYEMNGEAAFFKLSLLYSGTPAPEISAFEKYNPSHYHTSGQQDLVLIPAFEAVESSLSQPENKELLPWIQQQYKHGAEIGSFCTGAFLLAASGLLDGKEATTHINASPAFAVYFPDVILKQDAVVTHSDGIYTSGGATSTFHLLLKMIHNYCNRDVAVRMAKIFAIDMNREQQSYFGIFTPVRDHGDDLVYKIQNCIENDYDKSITIEDILQQIPSSRRNIIRRFKQATGNTLIEYLQKTRIEAAKKLLEQTNQSILEVMMHSGYNDTKAFRQLFKKSSGMTPKDYRDKFKPRAA